MIQKKAAKAYKMKYLATSTSGGIQKLLKHQ